MDEISFAKYKAKKTIEQRNIELMDFLNSSKIKYSFIDSEPAKMLELSRTDLSHELRKQVEKASGVIFLLDSTFIIELDFFDESISGNF